MKTDLPIKCEETYMKINKQGFPEYGFKVKRGCIREFFYYGETPKEIILPVIEGIVATKDDGFDIGGLEYKNDINLQQYVEGNVKIGEHCFRGIKEATIVVPNNNSYKLVDGCFDKGAKIIFKLPKNMGLKQVCKTYDAGSSYECESSTVLADKRLKGEAVFDDETFTVLAYNQKIDKTGYSLSVCENNTNKKSTTAQEERTR